jgi:hypothetical protein
METLGRSRIAQTLDTYSHVLPALNRDAAEAMDRVIEHERSFPSQLILGDFGRVR